VLKSIGPGVYAAIDGPAHRSGSNAGFVIGDDGVLVIDSFFDPDAAKALLGEIRRLTPKPVRYVVNTHYHIDHVRGTRCSGTPARSSSPTATCAAGSTARTST
jgi:cyclase